LATIHTSSSGTTLERQAGRHDLPDLHALAADHAGARRRDPRPVEVQLRLVALRAHRGGARVGRRESGLRGLHLLLRGVERGSARGGGGLGGVELLATHHAARRQLAIPLDILPRALGVGPRLLDGGACRGHLRHRLAHALLRSGRGDRGREVGIGLRQLGDVLAIVDLHQQVTGAHVLVLLDGHSGHETGHLGGHRHEVAFDLRVVGAHVMKTP
jgi:hypothetical protein